MPDLDHLQFGWLTADTARLLRTVFARRVRGLGLTRAQWLALTRINRRAMNRGPRGNASLSSSPNSSAKPCWTIPC